MAPGTGGRRYGTLKLTGRLTLFSGPDVVDKRDSPTADRPSLSPPGASQVPSSAVTFFVSICTIHICGEKNKGSCNLLSSASTCISKSRWPCKCFSHRPGDKSTYVANSYIPPEYFLSNLGTKSRKLPLASTGMHCNHSLFLFFFFS